MKPLIIYHKNCLDGLGAAAAAYSLLKENAEYLAMAHGDALPEVADRNVYFLDFSVPPAEMYEVCKRAKDVFLIDHHKTALEALEYFPKKFKNFSSVGSSEHHSGCVLAWKFFRDDEPVPELLLAIEDRDLWKFERPQTKAICAYLKATEWSVRELALAFDLDDMATTFETYGELLLNQHHKLVEMAAKNAAKVDRFILCNAPPNLASDLGSKLAGQAGTAIIYSIGAKYINLSFRSGPDGEDVSELAKQLGGGGHKHAAGAQLKIGANVAAPFLQQLSAVKRPE